MIFQHKFIAIYLLLLIVIKPALRNVQDQILMLTRTALGV